MEDLHWLLGEPRYTTPLQDEAPWSDPDYLDSFDFYGVYPLEISGIEDSTVEATIVESVIDGGYVSRPRRKTRSVVFTALLIGASEAACEFGMHWLRSVLTGGACYSKIYGTCGGAELCYLSSVPTMQEGGEVDADECYARVGRSLREVTTITGPAVTRKMELERGGNAWSVTWTMVAANPAEFGVERPLVKGFLDPQVQMPYVTTTGEFDAVGNVQVDTSCAVEVYRPVYDPLCALVSAPPDVPTIPPTCFTFPPNFRRTMFTVPRDAIPLWMDVVPIISVTTKAVEARSIRVRFYADMFETGDPSSDPCNFCGDVVFSYIPPGSTIVLNGPDRSIYIDQPGLGRRRADSLVSDSKGNPFEWPEFSCGFGYIVTVDMPQQQSERPVLDLSLVARVA